MPIRVTEAIDSDTAEIIKVERKSEGAYVNGIYQEGSVSVLKMLASVQQPSPKELQYLPEGERDKDVKMFISNKPLRQTSDRDNIQADIVIHKGKKYKIILSGDWDSYGQTTSYGARIQ